MNPSRSGIPAAIFARGSGIPAAKISGIPAAIPVVGATSWSRFFRRSRQGCRSYRESRQGCRSYRRWVIVAMGMLATACGGGGGGGDGPPPNVTITGVVTYDFVPAVAGLGLHYDATEARPVRGAVVELVAGANVLASTKTGTSGAYALSAPANTSVFVRVKALMQQAGAPSWDFRVVDNTSNDALYALDGPVFDTGTAASTRNLHAPSGWGGSSYTGPRAAAPFAILDTVYEAATAVTAVDPAVNLPPLVLHWSTENRRMSAGDGLPDPDSGEIGTSFASAELGGIFLLGQENVDTDEYDRHVVAHELAHYFEYALSRTDSIGGPHAISDRLDLRTAFSEGFSNALAAIVLGDSVYRDATGSEQGAALAFDVEGPASPLQRNPGWFTEQAVHEILYDLVDADQDRQDQLAMDLRALYDVLVGDHGTVVALTSIFTFIDALKKANVAEAELIDALVADQAIATIVDEYGSNETNDAGSADVLPIYTPMMVNGPAVNVCSTNEFSSAATGSTNKLGSRRFLRFSAGSAATFTFRAVATLIPGGEIADPDLALHQRGIQLPIEEDLPAPNCSVQAQDCVEQFSRFLSAGDYVLEVYEYTNTQDEDSGTPPIGRTCFDVTVRQQ